MGALPVQTPRTHASVPVQALPSLQGTPSDFSGLLHAPAAQTPAV
jgi:hypothetical protein